MPTVWVTKEFEEAVTSAGYDLQKYVTLLTQREFSITNELKSSLKLTYGEQMALKKL